MLQWLLAWFLVEDLLHSGWFLGSNCSMLTSCRSWILHLFSLRAFNWDCCEEFGIKIWPGAGVVGDRKPISEFTEKDEEDLNGFSVSSPDYMVLDQSVNNTWKNNPHGLYSTLSERKPLPVRKKWRICQRHEVNMEQLGPRNHPEYNGSSIKK